MVWRHTPLFRIKDTQKRLDRRAARVAAQCLRETYCACRRAVSAYYGTAAQVTAAPTLPPPYAYSPSSPPARLRRRCAVLIKMPSEISHLASFCFCKYSSIITSSKLFTLLFCFFASFLSSSITSSGSRRFTWILSVMFPTSVSLYTTFVQYARYHGGIFGYSVEFMPICLKNDTTMV